MSSYDQIAQSGAMVVGIDLSVKLLEIAQHEEAVAPFGIKYIHDDAQRLSRI